MLHNFRVRALLSCLLLLASALSDAEGRSVSLAWVPNPAPDIAGDIVRYGVESGVYISSITVPGQFRRVTLTNLPPLDSLFFAAYCYDTNGVESPPSNEMVATCSSPPTIASVPDQTTAQDTASAPIPVIVGSSQSQEGDVLVTGFSSNPDVLPDANIILAGEGTNRTVTLIPAPGRFGIVTVGIFVSDGCSTTNTAFHLAVVERTPMPPPRIGTLVFDNKLGLYWQNWTNSYELQSTSSLSPPVHWQTIGNFPAEVNPASIITTSRPIAGSNQFFRVLARPPKAYP